MPDEIKLDKDQYTKAEVQALVESELNKFDEKMEVTELVSKMTDAEKAHYGTLEKSAADEFLFASSEERGVVLSKAAELDAVVYTATDGTEIRKSDGAKLLKMAKDNDANTKRIETMHKAAETTRIESFVKSELQFLPGELNTRVEIVKAVEGIADDKVREDAFSVLKAQNAKMSKAFASNGTTDTPNISKGGASGELESLTKAYQKNHPEVGYIDAYDVVSKANPELYTKAVGGE